MHDYFTLILFIHLFITDKTKHVGQCEHYILNTIPQELVRIALNKQARLNPS